MNPRRLLTAAGITLAALVLYGQIRHLLTDPAVWPPDDFVEYWAAARLTLDGENPYDPAHLLPLQRTAGRDTDKAVMMWNPPWSLPVVLPLGLLPPREAQVLWLLVNLTAVGFCGDRLWLLLGGNRERRSVGWVVALAFVPTLFALQSGQISPLVLLGAVLFLEAERRGWHLAAGVATVLLAVKPHLAYLVWAAILVDAVARRRLGVILGGLAAGTAASLIPLAFDPHLLHQYADAMGNRPPAEWVSPTPGTLLRFMFGTELFRLQFVPVLAGLAWFVWYWRTAGAYWDWAEQLPLLLLVSFVTAPYGAWPFDMVLLLPAVVKLVVVGLASPRRVPGRVVPLAFRHTAAARALLLVVLSAINAACLLMNLYQTSSFAFIWVSPAILALYVVGIKPVKTRAYIRGTPLLVPA